MENKYLVSAEDLTSVADAIREKGGTAEPIVFPGGFVSGIHELSSLNFEVVGGTVQPENPKENTIWVNTDREITGWIFSTTEPEGPDAGMVWFTVTAAPTPIFNALKENTLNVYANKCRQYSNDSWTECESKIYTDEEWRTFREWLFHYTSDASNWSAYSIGTGGSFSAKDDVLTIQMNQGSDHQSGPTCVQYNGFTELTGYSMLTVVFGEATGYIYGVAIGVSNVHGYDDPGKWKAKKNYDYNTVAPNIGVFRCNIENVQSGYITIYAGNSHESRYGASTVKVLEVYLE